MKTEDITNQQLLSDALARLHLLEDRTGYENKKLDEAINNLQTLINKI